MSEMILSESSSELELIKNLLLSHKPDLIDLGKRIKQIDPATLSDEDRGTFDEIQEEYDKQHKTTLDAIKTNLGAIVDKINHAKYDPDEFLALPPDLYPEQFNKQRQLLKDLSPADEDLARFQVDEELLEEMEFFVLSWRGIQEEQRKAEIAEKNGQPGADIVRHYTLARDRARNLSTSPRLKIDTLIGKARGLANQANAARIKAADRFEIVTSVAELTYLVRWISEWTDTIKKKPALTAEVIEFFRQWDTDDVERMPREEALDIARLRLQRREWRNLIYQYVAEADSIYTKPEGDPRDAMGRLNNIKFLTGLEDPNIGLNIYPDDNRTANRAVERIKPAADLRAVMAKNCASVKQADLFAAHQALLKAAANWEDEKDLRFPDQEVAEPKELSQARANWVRWASDRYEKLIAEAVDQIAQGRLTEFEGSIVEGKRLSALQWFSTSEQNLRAFKDLNEKLEIIRTARAGISNARGEPIAEKRILDELIAKLDGLPVLQWPEFSALNTRLDAYFNMEKTIQQMEIYSQQGGMLKVINQQILLCKGLETTISPEYQTRFVMARNGLQAWKGLLSAEEITHTNPAKAFQALRPALRYEITRSRAEEVKEKLDKLLISDEEAAKARSNIQDFLKRKEYRKAYDEAEKWYKEPTRFSTDFLRQRDEIRNLWENSLRNSLEDLKKTPEKINREYTRIRKVMADLNYLRSPLYEEVHDTLELQCAEAEARFKLANCPPKGNIPWKEVEEACLTVHQLALELHEDQKIAEWWVRLGRAKKQVVFESIRNATLADRIKDLRNLNDDLHGQDPEVWYRIGEAQFSLGTFRLENSQLNNKNSDPTFSISYEFDNAFNSALHGTQILESQTPKDSALAKKLAKLMENSRFWVRISKDWADILETLNRRPLTLSHCLEARTKYLALGKENQPIGNDEDGQLDSITQQWERLVTQTCSHLESQKAPTGIGTKERLTIYLSKLALDPGSKNDLKNATDEVGRVYNYYVNRVKEQVGNYTGKNLYSNPVSKEISSAYTPAAILEQYSSDPRRELFDRQLAETKSILKEMEVIISAFQECNPSLNDAFQNDAASFENLSNTLSTWKSTLQAFQNGITTIFSQVDNALSTGEFTAVDNGLQTTGGPFLNFGNHPTYAWLSEYCHALKAWRRNLEMFCYRYVWAADLYVLDERFDYKEYLSPAPQDENKRQERLDWNKLWTDARAARKTSIEARLNQLLQYYQQAIINSAQPATPPEETEWGKITQQLRMADTYRRDWFSSFRNFYITQDLSPVKSVLSILSELERIDPDDQSLLLSRLDWYNPHDQKVLHGHMAILKQAETAVSQINRIEQWIKELELIVGDSPAEDAPTAMRVVPWMTKRQEIQAQREQGLFKEAILETQRCLGGNYCTNKQCSELYNFQTDEICKTCKQPLECKGNLYAKSTGNEKDTGNLLYILSLLDQRPVQPTGKLPSAMADIEMRLRVVRNNIQGYRLEAEFFLKDLKTKMSLLQKAMEDFTRDLVQWEGMGIFTSRQARANQRDQVQKDIKAVLDICVAYDPFLNIWTGHSNIDPLVSTLYQLNNPEIHRRMDEMRTRSKLGPLMGRTGI